jgi:hypothetical protein
MNKELVFINSTGDTFTPTQSGAIATWVWEMCRAAQSFGLEPWVISKSSSADAYPWTRTVLLEYPFPAKIKGAGRLAGWLGRMRGWAHICQGEWVKHVLRYAAQRGLSEGILVFHNDPEMVAALRPALPRAVLVHLFHNCNRSRAPWRERFGAAVDVALGRKCLLRTLERGILRACSSHPAQWSRRCSVCSFAAGVLNRLLFSDSWEGLTDRRRQTLLLRAALKLSQRGVPFSVQMLGARFYGNHSSDAYQCALAGAG